MELFLRKLFKGDKVIWVVFTLLCVISLLECFSAIGTLAYKHHAAFRDIARHGFFLLVGYVIVVAFSNFDYRKWTGVLMYLALAASVVLLPLTLKSGETVNGASRWFNIFGLAIQPSEVAKLALVLYTGWTLGKAKRSEAEMDKAFWKVLAVTAVFVMLIVSQNMSTALMMAIFSFLMLFVAGAPRGKMLRLFLLVVGVGVLLFFLLIKIPSIPGVDRWGTWHNRLTTEKLDVKDPNYRRTDENTQIHYAKIAVAQGKVLGCLPGNSTQRDFLPQAFSDFIFAIIIEDLGWLGLFGVPLLYLILLIRIRKICRNCTKAVPVLLAMGSALIVCLQAFVNMSVAVGFFPVTGQPLPLISRGGSSGLITCVYFGIILSVSRFGASEDEAAVQAVREQEALADAALDAQAAAEAAERLARQEAAAREQSVDSYASMAE